MSRRRFISQRRLSQLIEGCTKTMGPEPTIIVMAPFQPHQRKRIWAALHNKLNKGHPDGPRKPHRWTSSS